MERYENYYFKRGKNLMSGIHLPATVKDTYFKDCDFHPNCWGIKFIRCTFDGCEIKNCLAQAIDCEYVNDDGGIGGQYR